MRIQRNAPPILALVMLCALAAAGRAADVKTPTNTKTTAVSFTDYWLAVATDEVYFLSSPDREWVAMRGPTANGIMVIGPGLSIQNFSIDSTSGETDLLYLRPANGVRLIYRHNYISRHNYQLSSQQLTEAAPIVLHPQAGDPPDSTAGAFNLSPSGNYVIYPWSRLDKGLQGYRVAPVQGGAPIAVATNEVYSNTQHDFLQLTPDDQKLVAARKIAANSLQFYARPLHSDQWTTITNALPTGSSGDFLITADSQWILTSMVRSVDGYRPMTRFPVAGGAVTEIGGPYEPGEYVTDWIWTSDRRRLVVGSSVSSSSWPAPVRYRRIDPQSGECDFYLDGVGIVETTDRNLAVADPAGDRLILLTPGSQNREYYLDVVSCTGGARTRISGLLATYLGHPTDSWWPQVVGGRVIYQQFITPPDPNDPLPNPFAPKLIRSVKLDGSDPITLATVPDDKLVEFFHADPDTGTIYYGLWGFSRNRTEAIHAAQVDVPASGHAVGLPTTYSAGVFAPQDGDMIDPVQLADGTILFTLWPDPEHPLRQDPDDPKRPETPGELWALVPASAADPSAWLRYE